MIAFDSRPPRGDVAAPFELKGEPSRAACLLLHGFACSPHTMRSLGLRMHRAGIPVYCPLLPGHGEPLNDFNSVQAEDWIEAALASHAYLQQRYEKVAVVGFSMGGTLGLQVASRTKIESLTLIASPVYLDHWVERIYPVAKAVTSALPVVFDVANPVARRRRKAGVHKVVPVKAVGQLLELLEDTRERLDSIRCPILVAQSRSDHTVPPSNAPFILERVASEKRRLIWLRRAFHVLPVDFGYRRLEAEIIRFYGETEQISAEESA